jgi:hypothetical protein
MAAVPKSSPTDGGFFSLFDLPPTLFRAEAVAALGSKMAEIHPPKSGDIPSGYVYLGQFITHDVTSLAPPASISTSQDELVNLTTPTLDLNNVYGQGFGEVFVDQKTARMKLGAPSNPHDLPREKDGTPLTPEQRDDENLLISQLHVQFLKLHNFFVGKIALEKRHQDLQELFDLAREQTILHYQQVVLYDYLDTVLDGGVWEHVIAQNRGTLWDPTAAELPRMPVEFSAAAFRFAHSMVRTEYTINSSRRALLPELFRPNKFVNAADVVDWNFFFLRIGQAKSAKFNSSSAIDVSVPIIVPQPLPQTALATKDLRAGNRALLPHGQQLMSHVLQHHRKLADAVGLRHLSPAELNPHVAIGEGSEYREGSLLQMLDKDYGFERKTPLWYYILVEAHATRDGYRLGPLGSLIVAEVLRALVYLSSPSILRAPFKSSYIKPTKEIHGKRYLRMTDLLGVL